MPPKTVVVIGAGVSGLCTAFWLKKSGTDVIVLEREEVPGGTIRTIREEGWLIENGPNSALETTPLLQELFTELGIAGRKVYANDSAARRYIVKQGRLRPLPAGPFSFLASRLWSPAGKLRLLGEPFAGRAAVEETVAEFVERRLGREFLDYAINPFVAGVYAGDPARLSVRSAFPKLYALEEKYGGLLVGALRSRGERKRRGEVAKDRARLFSFTEGMQVFPDALAAALGDSVRFGAAVSNVIPVRAGRYPVYTVTYMSGNARHSLQADAVIFSSPAPATAEIIRPIDPGTSSVLESIAYPPVAEVFLGFRDADVRRNLDGFGFLVPEVERCRILGTIWSSTLFPHRAPEGHVATTTFVGGARQPALVSISDEELLGIVAEELKELIGVAGAPAKARVIRWSRAIPQYELGYWKILASIDRFEQNFSGSFICSNFRGGIAVGDCVRSASQTATKVLAQLALR